VLATTARKEREANEGKDSGNRGKGEEPRKTKGGRPEKTEGGGPLEGGNRKRKRENKD
jgi:hypothetical protein